MLCQSISYRNILYFSSHSAPTAVPGFQSSLLLFRFAELGSRFGEELSHARLSPECRLVHQRLERVPRQVNSIKSVHMWKSSYAPESKANKDEIASSSPSPPQAHFSVTGVARRFPANDTIGL